MRKNNFKQDNIGAVSLLTVGILFGLSGVFAKYLATWMNAYQTVFIRFIISFALGIIILVAKRQQFNIAKVDKTKLALFAISFPGQAIFFTLSVFYTKVALAVFSFYIANLVSSFILGALLFKEKIDTKKGIALILIFGSLICFTKPFNGFVLDIGFIFGLIAGVIQTVASIFQKTIGDKTDRLSLIIIQTFTGAVIAFIAMIFTNTVSFSSLQLSGLVVAIIFGGVFLAISYLMLIGFQRTNLNVGTLLISSELFFGPLFAYFAFGQSLGTLEIFGGILTIAAVVLVNSNFSK
jgi:drug/metabolite transporter (DMT)-like permease